MGAVEFRAATGRPCSPVRGWLELMGGSVMPRDLVLEARSLARALLDPWRCGKAQGRASPRLAALLRLRNAVPPRPACCSAVLLATQGVAAFRDAPG